jgi:DNA-binding transcriptional LysR family regulator
MKNVNNQVNLADVRAFVVIAKVKNFTLAAEQLSCSRSHVSKQLLSLEQALGVKLIIRTTRSQRLTEQGKLFFEKCFRALDEIDSAVEKVLDSSDNIQGQIKINCVGGFIGENIVSALVNDFIKQHPNISITLDFSSQRVDLISGEFDLVFRMGDLPDSNLVARKLMDIAVSTVASPDYFKRAGSLSHPQDLLEHACITGSVKQWHFHDKLDVNKQYDVSVTGQIQCKNGRTMLISALAGNGIIRVPSLYCQQYLNAGTLRNVFEDWHVSSTPLYVVYAKDKFQPIRLKTLINFITENFLQYIE